MQRQPLMSNSHSNSEKGKAIGRTHHAPERMCIGCRARRAPSALLCLACMPQGEVFAVRSRRIAGRSAYVCYDVSCMRKAWKPAKLAVALKRPVTVPPFETLYQSAVNLLHERIGACLSMAQRAGAAISGASLLHQALAQNRIIYLVLAEDIAAARADAYRSWCRQHNIPWITLFSKAELGKLIGKPSRSAIGLSAPRFRDLLATTVEPLTTLRFSLDGCETVGGGTQHIAS